MTKTVITGARVRDGLSEAAYPATVTIDGNRITAVDKSGAAPEESDASLRCATTVGQSLMGRAEDLGQVKPGFLADLLLVRGDVTRDVSLVQHQDNLSMIMKDGLMFKDPRQGIVGGGLIRAAE